MLDYQYVIFIFLSFLPQHQSGSSTSLCSSTSQWWSSRLALPQPPRETSICSSTPSTPRESLTEEVSRDIKDAFSYPPALCAPGERLSPPPQRPLEVCEMGRLQTELVEAVEAVASAIVTLVDELNEREVKKDEELMVTPEDGIDSTSLKHSDDQHDSKDGKWKFMIIWKTR